MPPRSKRCPNNAGTVLLRNQSSPWLTVASNRTKVMLTTAKPSPALAQQKPVNQADYHCGSSINWFLLLSIFLRSAWTLQKRLQVVQELLVSGRVLGASAHQYWPFDMQKGTWQAAAFTPRAYLGKSDWIVLYPSPWHEPEASDKLSYTAYTI